MKKKLLSRLLSLTLCAAMLFSVAACGDKETDPQGNSQEDGVQGEDSQEGDNTGSDDVVELECFFNAVGATCIYESVDRKFGEGAYHG